MDGKLFKRLFLIISILFIQACMSSSIYLNKDIVLENPRVVLMDSNNGPFGNKIKSSLRSRGYKIVIDNNQIIENTNSTSKITKVNLNANLKLNYTAESYDYCFGGGMAMRYSISLIQISSGEEVYSQSGSACESAIINKLTKNLP